MSKVQRLEAELRAAQLEERLVDLKVDPDAHPDELRGVKDALRQARQDFRVLREQEG